MALAENNDHGGGGGDGGSRCPSIDHIRLPLSAVPAAAAAAVRSARDIAGGGGVGLRNERGRDTYRLRPNRGEGGTGGEEWARAGEGRGRLRSKSLGQAAAAAAAAPAAPTPMGRDPLLGEVRAKSSGGEGWRGGGRVGLEESVNSRPGEMEERRWWERNGSVAAAGAGVGAGASMSIKQVGCWCTLADDGCVEYNRVYSCNNIYIYI